MVKIARPLEAKYGKDYPVRAKQMPKLMLMITMIMRLRDPEMIICKSWGKGDVYDGTRAVDILGIEYCTLDMRNPWWIWQKFDYHRMHRR